MWCVCVWGVMSYSHSCSSPSSPAAVRRAELGVMRAGELSLSLIGYGTWESRPYTLPGQYSGVGPDGEGTEMLTLVKKIQVS